MHEVKDHTLQELEAMYEATQEQERERRHASAMRKARKMPR